MTNALQIYSQFDTLRDTAIALQQSGYFKDVASQAQAIVKVMAGAELGLPPFASMAGIHIVQGKPVLGSNVIATLVKNDPRYDYRVKVSTDKACILTWYENGHAVGEAGFTIEEANAAGLTNKQTWKQYASDMLFARAISRGARRFAPGIFGGAPVYTPDEMNVDTDEDGYVIEGEIVASEPVQPRPERAAPTITKPQQESNGNAPVKETPLAAALKRMHALGTKLHGDNWDAKRAAISTELGYTSSKDWSYEEVEGVISDLAAGLNEKLAAGR